MLYMGNDQWLSPVSFARRIIDIITDDNEWYQLSVAGRHHVSTRLNATILLQSLIIGLEHTACYTDHDDLNHQLCV